MIKVTKNKMESEDVDFIKVEDGDEVAVFFEGDLGCFYHHLLSVGIDRATAITLKETYKNVI